jgi:iron complex transport system ATP-binding protein
VTFIDRLFLGHSSPRLARPVTVRTTLQVSDIVLRRDGTTILDGASLRIRSDERWVIIGANGSGKTSLMRVMAMYDHPTSGTVEVLGERLGTTDVRELRRSIGYLSAALADQLRGDLSVHDVVRTARYAALEPWWHRYTPADDERADLCLSEMAVSQLRDRRFGTLSSGEQQRVLLARTLMNEPAVILLDEPSARLDLGGREQLVHTLADLANDPTAAPFAIVTHHVDEIPHGVTHAALVKSGTIFEQGPLENVMTSASLSECFSTPLVLERRVDGRYSAWGKRADVSPQG